VKGLAEGQGTEGASDFAELLSTKVQEQIESSDLSQQEGFKKGLKEGTKVGGELDAFQTTESLDPQKLSEALEELEEELEALGEEGVMALLQLFHQLESTGPVGIRVQAGGESGVALPMDAERAWTELALALQNGVESSQTQIHTSGAEGQSESARGTELSQLLQRLVSSIRGESGQIEASGAQAQVSGLNQSMTNQAQIAVDSKSPTAALESLRRLSENAKLQGNVPAGDEEVVEESAPKTQEYKKAVLGQDSAVDLTKDLEKEVSKESQKAQSSAVVVLRSKVDGLRGKMLRALDQAMKFKTPSLENMSQQEWLSQDWSKIKAWLEKATQTAGQSLEQALQKISSKDALGFLNFVANQRQKSLRGAFQQASEVQLQVGVDESEGGETQKSQKGDVLEGAKSSKTTPVFEGSLESVTVRTGSINRLNRLEPAIQSPLAVVEASVTASTLESLDPVASDPSEAQQAPKERDGGLDPLAAKSIEAGDRGRESKAAQEVQPQRFDRDLMDRVVQQTKNNLKVWMDRKLVAMQVQMEPVELGKMQMRTVLEQGRIGVLLQVENTVVKDLIQQQIQAMREVLEAQGLEVAGFYVEVWQQDQQAAGQNSQKSSGPQFNMDRLLGDEGPEDDPTPPQKKGLIDQVA
jgi:flagellar hook-length control protein FliK